MMLSLVIEAGPGTLDSDAMSPEPFAVYWRWPSSALVSWFTFRQRIA
jgi:hypothetical protein